MRFVIGRVTVGVIFLLQSKLEYIGIDVTVRTDVRVRLSNNQVAIVFTSKRVKGPPADKVVESWYACFTYELCILDIMT
jgi:hypothetical protein